MDKENVIKIHFGIYSAIKMNATMPYVAWIYLEIVIKSEDKLKSLLMKLKEEKEKAGLKFKTQETKFIHPVLSLHGKQMGKKWK